MTGQQKLIFVRWQVLTKAIFAPILELKATTGINKCFIANGKEQKKNKRRGKRITFTVSTCDAGSYLERNFSG